MNTVQRVARRLLLTAGAVCLACLSVHGVTDDIPELTVGQCAVPPRIDGNLDDACWQAVPPITSFHIVGEDRTTAAHRAWVTRDDEWLYVAFAVYHPHPELIRPQVTQRDGLVQREDCVKVAFDPGTGGKVFYHIRLSAGNVISDQRNSVTAGYDKDGWNIPIRSATRITDKGWQAEMALPFVLLVGIGDLAQARLNLIIHSFLPLVDNQAVKVGEKREVASWAAVGPNWWSEPQRFGWITGLAGVDFKAPFLPFVKKARVGRYSLVEGQYRYDVTAELEALSGRAGKVVLAVEDRPDQGEPTEVRREVDLTGGQTLPVTVPVPVRLLSKRTVVLSMRDGVTGEVLQTEPIPDTGALDLFSAFLDRSYYTGEAFATAVCAVGLPAEGLPGTRLQARSRDGAVVGEQPDVTTTARLAIPLAARPVGAQQLSIELRDKNGGLMSSQSVTLTKRAPNPGGEVKIDRENRVVLRDGTPFFPYGFCMSGVLPSQEQCFRAVGDAGFNSILHWYPIRDATVEVDAYLEVAAKHGLQVVMWPDRYSAGVTLRDPGSYLSGPMLETVRQFMAKSGPVKDIRYYPQFGTLTKEQATRIFNDATEQNIERYLTVVRRSMAHANLLAYMIFDEPIAPSSLDQFAAGRRLYAKYNEVDGYHPCYTNYSSEIPPGREAIEWVDILCTDPYWVPGGRKSRGTPNYVSRIVRETRRRADSNREVTWAIPMAEYWSSSWRRLLLPQEQRCQTYLALIHGAKGLFYYLLPWHQANWVMLKALAQEMKTLGPVVVAPEVPQAIRYGPGSFNLDQGVFPDVQASLHRDPAGGLVLLCANSQWYPVDVTLRIPQLGSRTAVRRLFAAATLAVKDGAFGERLEPFGTRAYALDVNAESTAPIRLDVEMTPHPELGREEAPAAKRFAGGRKNLMANSSFEDATVPLWPDYYKPHMSPLRFPQGLLGTADSPMRLDTDRPVHGKTCLRLSPPPQQILGFYIEEGQEFIDDPYVGDSGVPYVFSAYLRGERDGLKVRLGHAAKDEVTVTTEWKRYSWRITLPTRIWLFANFDLKQPGTVWFDALQVEKGTEPTAFEP